MDSLFLLYLSYSLLSHQVYVNPLAAPLLELRRCRVHVSYTFGLNAVKNRKRQK